MKIGFSGTQKGMTGKQCEAVETFLNDRNGQFHHGDCIGADKQAHEIAESLGFFRIYIHPPIDNSKRAFCQTDSIRMYAPRAYLVRNMNIVLLTDCLVAAPATEREQLRSGTWSTIRFADRMRKPCMIILPSGLVRHQGPSMECLS